jgi:D-amino-acid dehydrogenase
MQNGTLKIYTKREAFDANVAESERQRDVGLIFEPVGPRRCVEIEPALGRIEHTLVGGIYAPPDEHGDCHKFAVGLRKFCSDKLGVTFHFNTDIRKIERSGDRVTGVETSKGTMTGDAYVAALARLPGAARRSACEVSIYPAKGVTVTVPDTAWPEGPKVPIIDDTGCSASSASATGSACLRLGRVQRLRHQRQSGAGRGDRQQRPSASSGILEVLRPEFRQGVGRAAADAVVGQSLCRSHYGEEPLPELWPCHLGWTLACGSSASSKSSPDGGRRST